MNNGQIATMLRVIHSGIVLYLLGSVAFLYVSIFTLETNTYLFIALVSLIIEGILVYLNHGNCPLAFIQRRYGDNTPFFDLVLPKRYARHAVRFFAVLTLVGIILLWIRLSLLRSI